MQGQRQVKMIIGVAAIDRNGPADQFGAGLGLAVLHRRHAEQIKRVGILRLQRQDFLIDRCGLVQLAGLVQAHRLAQHCVNLRTCHRSSPS